MSLRFLCLCYLFVTITYCTENGYYWRDYYGDIPKDALPGGLDKNGQPTYLGQIFIAKLGLLPVGIYPGETVAKGTWGYVVHSTDVYVKILCTPNPNNFYWLPITRGNFRAELAGKKAVTAGWGSADPGKPAVNFGRIFYQGQVIIGKTQLFDGEAMNPEYFPTDYFPWGKDERLIDSTFQVLIQNNSTQ